MKLVSWNVNGVRASLNKGLAGFIKNERADAYLFQEVKAREAPELPEGYHVFWHPAEKKGYSGVAVLSKKKPLSVVKGMGVEEFDVEGRVLTLEFDKFFLVNVYFPNAGDGLKRLGFKLGFNRVFENFCKKLDHKKPVIIGSDFNVAHKEIDLANPKTNADNAGFTPQERSWFDSFLKKGFADTFREFEKGAGHYTYWTYRFNARARNVGWRLDYFVASKRFVKKVKKSFILKDVTGSDHAPIVLEVDA